MARPGDRMEAILDSDLDKLTRGQLVEEVKRLRAGIRAHRDCSGHDLCWHHPQLWGLLPEKIDPAVSIPPWPKFLRGCVAYREALDREATDALIADVEYSPRSR
jgi:hypothetical protein